MRSFNSILFLFLIPLIGFSQTETKQPETYKDSTTNYFEVSGMGSNNGHTPFWIQANQFGTVPVTGPGGTARVGLEHYWPLSTNRNIWRAGLSVEAVGNYTANPKILLPQLNASLRFKNWEFFVGRKKQWVGLADSTLGSGSYAWSGNALPIPKIQIGTMKFVNVPFTKGWLAFQAFYSDGLFEKSRPITSGLKFHQKSFYMRIGKATSKVKLYGGFNHQVQWGGKSPYLASKDGKLPDGISNYFHAVFGTIGGSGDNQTNFDSTSRIGNHLGSIDAALEIETYGASILLYRQFVYEDGSLFYLTNLSDGLTGLRIKKKYSYGADFEITEGVFEVLFTKNQGGDVFVLGNGKYRGHDNYFNNQQVRDGWSYFDRTIGTPFITPTSQTSWKWPLYADNFTNNNRVLLYHLGLRGTLMRKIQWYTKLSYSSNSGTYLERFHGSPKQFSGLISLQTKLDVLGGLTLKGAYATDLGDLYRKTHGFTLGLRKDLSFY
ncbi:capsule assembly Wzi family protein [Dyadobacter luticola]|uniref:Capsule assembly Wzi family protein n=1 Tax=Dyadobacter luticola TaxID=1979387 RepID=A0A5R9KWU6_9BACT|nr:capsule assembly Wzi family protein [Dyadobacter luticola]TLV00772.1 capsule assembly Wzi family protein [Dyadobacter luticola]